MSLRNEIVESQKSRSDLFKWKIILIAILGSIGFGLNKNIECNQLILCLIPLICVYVDALCYHINIRICVIGGFQRVLSDGSEESKYEELCNTLRSVFVIEDWALDFVTRISSLFVSLYGLYGIDKYGLFRSELGGGGKEFNTGIFLFLAGFFCILISFFIKKIYRQKIDFLNEKLTVNKAGI